MRYQAFFISILAILIGQMVQAYTANKDIHKCRLGAIRELIQIFQLIDSAKIDNEVKNIWCLYYMGDGYLDIESFGCQGVIGNRTPPNEISIETYQKMTAQEFNELFFLPFYSLFCQRKTLIDDIKALPDSLNHFGLASYMLAELSDSPEKELAYIEEAIRINPYIEAFYVKKIGLLCGSRERILKNEKEIFQHQEKIIECFNAIISFTPEKWFYQYEKHEFLEVLGEEEQAKDALTQAIDNLSQQIEGTTKNTVASEIEQPESGKLLGKLYYARAWSNEKTHLLDEAYSDLEKAFHYGYIDEQFLIRKKKEYAKASKKNGN